MPVVSFRPPLAAPAPKRRGWWRVGGLGVLLAAALAAGCSQTAPAAKEKKVEVVVTTPVHDEVLDYQDFTGRIDAYRTIDVRARVTGYVDEAPFKEGDRVVENQTVLFRIDPRTYKADLEQAKANLKLAAAERDLQELNADRARKLFASRSIGKEEYDQIMAARDKAAANVGSMQAAVDRAELYLKFTEIKAPVTGRISRRYVDPGNLVKADDTVLTTVVADDQVYAYFDVDERSYLERTGEGLTAVPDERLKALKIPVLMRLANGENYTHAGVVDFLDNRLNGNTGTIRMRALFKNPHDNLKAGLFVRVRMPLGKPYPALLIPDEAVQSDQGRKFVFVVKAVTEAKDGGPPVTKDVVEYRPVTIGQALKEKLKDGSERELRVIHDARKDADGKVAEGLEPGERVVVSGMQRVRAGTVVAVKDQPPPKAPGSPLIQLLNHRDTETQRKQPEKN